GDVIIDEYRYCKPFGKSQKSSNIVVKCLNTEKFAGGVLASANHLAGYTDNLTLLTTLGDVKDHTDFISHHLNPKIKKKFYIKPNTTTTLKRRYVEAGFIEKLFEICFIDDFDLPQKISGEICEYLDKHIRDFDVVVVNDFGHGLINKDMIDIFSKAKVYLAVNAQTNSANYGYNMITKYKNVDYTCIDEPELRLAAQDKNGDVRNLLLKCYDKLNSRTMTVTRGHNGSTVYNSKHGFIDIPVFSTKIVDTVGAGDAYFAITSTLDKLGFKPIEIGFIGNCVGALAVQIVGNKEPIEQQRLYKFMTAMLK
ncbi:MAG: cytidyltransferase, partial [Spirochaetes bacterium]|nr:cytidyltransferase [Spirochaetota bacterium]